MDRQYKRSSTAAFISTSFIQIPYFPRSCIKLLSPTTETVSNKRVTLVRSQPSTVDTRHPFRVAILSTGTRAKNAAKGFAFTRGVGRFYCRRNHQENKWINQEREEQFWVLSLALERTGTGYDFGALEFPTNATRSLSDEWNFVCDEVCMMIAVENRELYTVKAILSKEWKFHSIS